jgi:hypothetical protein
MKKTITILSCMIYFLSVKCQTFPDKIIVVQNIYQSQYYTDMEDIIDSDTVVFINKRKISDLFTELVKFDEEKQLLAKFEIDTTFILNNPNEILKLYKGYNENKIDWNKKQTEFIFGKLTDINAYTSGLNKYFSSYIPDKPYHRFPKLLKRNGIVLCGMGMPTIRYEYVVSLYNKNTLTNIFTSRKSTAGFNFPYKDQSNRVVYNFKIDRQLNTLFKREVKIDEPLKGNDLLKYIVTQIVDNNMLELYKLSGYSYEKEISELSNDFEIISSEEVHGRGRYIWDEPKTIKITLKNKYMLPNVYLQFLASKYGETLYSRDSVKENYKEIVARVQAIPFITNYLQHDSSARLDIYYFNNSGINQYNIDGVNKNPTEWKKQDKYIESLKWYEKSSIKPSFDINEAIKTSESNYCGCNYRFESDFIKKAIFFEITSNRNVSSIWFLLPDDTILLYHVESYHLDDANVLDIKLDKLGNSTQLPFSCLRFDKYGTLIERK